MADVAGYVTSQRGSDAAVRKYIPGVIDAGANKGQFAATESDYTRLSGGTQSPAQTSGAVPPGWSPTAWAQQQADMAKYFPSANPTQPTSAKDIGTTAPAAIPPPPVPGNPTNTVTGNNGALANPLFGLSTDANGNLVFNSTTAEGTFADIAKARLATMSAPPKIEDIYNSLPEKAAFENAQKEVQNRTAELNAIVTKSQADQLSTIGQGRGIPEAIIGGQQAQIAREAAIKALPVQALLSAAQGNLQMAQQHLDTVFKLRSEDAKAQYDYRNKIIDTVLDYATKAEERKLNDIKTQSSTNLSLLNNSINQAQSISNSILDRDPQKAAALTRLTPPSVTSPTFQQDLAEYNRQVSNIQASVPPKATGGGTLTPTQFNEGAVRAGVDQATFKSYPSDVQSFFTQTSDSNIQPIKDELTAVATGGKKATDFETYLKSQSIAPTVKNFLIAQAKEAEKLAPPPKPGFFSNLWNQIF